MTPLVVAALTVFILVLLAGLLISVFGLPGNLLIFFAALAYAVVTGFSPLGFKTLLALLLMALLAEGLEFVLEMGGAHRLVASKRGLAAALVGGLAGAFILTSFLYGLGTLVGLFLGAYAGAWGTEIIRQWKLKSAFRADPPDLLGRAAGDLVKGALTVGMVVTTLITIYS